MENSIIVTVNLNGAIGGFIKSVDTQNHAVALDGGKIARKDILHTDREIMPCNRSFPVTGSVVASWVNGPAPSWAHSGRWRDGNTKQRIGMFIRGFDEGFGTTFDSIEDGGN